MKLMIEIRMDNAAFEDTPVGELRNILTNLWQDAPSLVGYGRAAQTGSVTSVQLPLRDSNGNTVGWARVED